MTKLDVDKGRVERSWGLGVTDLGGGQYRVTTTGGGDSASYFYYTRVSPNLLCYCSDAAYRSQVCKHLVATLIAADDPRAEQFEQWLADSPSASPASVPEHDPVTGEPYPDAYSLSDALKDQANPERSRSRRLAGRILTDPEAGLPEWRLVAERCPKVHIRAALLRIPEAAADPQVRKAVVDDEPNAFIIGQLLPTASPEEFRRLFRKLIEAGAEKKALEVFKESPSKGRSLLRPSDLTGLFNSEQRPVREEAMRILSGLGTAVDRESDRGRTDPMTRSRSVSP